MWILNAEGRTIKFSAMLVLVTVALSFAGCGGIDPVLSDDNVPKEKDVDKEVQEAFNLQGAMHYHVSALNDLMSDARRRKLNGRNLSLEKMSNNTKIVRYLIGHAENAAVYAGKFLELYVPKAIREDKSIDLTKYTITEDGYVVLVENNQPQGLGLHAEQEFLVSTAAMTNYLPNNFLMHQGARVNLLKDAAALEALRIKNINDQIAGAGRAIDNDGKIIANQQQMIRNMILLLEAEAMAMYNSSLAVHYQAYKQYSRNWQKNNRRKQSALNGMMRAVGLLNKAERQGEQCVNRLGALERMWQSAARVEMSQKKIHVNNLSPILLRLKGENFGQECIDRVLRKGLDNGGTTAAWAGRIPFHSNRITLAGNKTVVPVAKCTNYTSVADATEAIKKHGFLHITEDKFAPTSYRPPQNYEDLIHLMMTFKISFGVGRPEPTVTYNPSHVCDNKFYKDALNNHLDERLKEKYVTDRDEELPPFPSYYKITPKKGYYDLRYLHRYEYYGHTANDNRVHSAFFDGLVNRIQKIRSCIDIMQEAVDPKSAPAPKPVAQPAATTATKHYLTNFNEENFPNVSRSIRECAEKTNALRSEAHKIAADRAEFIKKWEESAKTEPPKAPNPPWQRFTPGIGANAGNI